MKRDTIFYIFPIILLVLFTSCLPPDSEPAVDYWCNYNVELNVKNETDNEKTVQIQGYALDNGNCACSYYDKSLKTISPKLEQKFSATIFLEYTQTAYLSHIITIDGKNFAGFDTDLYEIEDYVENAHKKMTSVKKNLGSVNWRDSKFPVITYEGKTFETDKKFPEIKLIYTIVIKDEADISDSEKDEYVDGIKISVAHEVK